MDKLISARLDNFKGNKHYDAPFAEKVAKTCRNYIDSGISALNYYIPDFDAATDLFEMYSPVVNAADFKNIDRNSPLNFRHPMTFVEMITLTTFLAQILFGGEQARAVEAQKDEDSIKADTLNALLAWNDRKIGIYNQGWLWLKDAVVYNRGIWYESPGQNVTIDREEVQEDDITVEPVQVMNDDGSPKLKRGKPIFEQPKITRTRTVEKYSGFYNRLDLVSPYDFICDPTLPLTRFHEGRYAAHRVYIPWIELERRSKLDVDDEQYVMPSAVKKIKNQKGSPSPATVGNQGQNTSRTYYDRQQRGATTAGIGGAAAGMIAGTDSINQDDGGIVECWCMTIRAKPSTLKMYPEDQEPELICILMTNQAEVLSLNIRDNKHGQYPYCVGEGRPNAHRQFSPGWALAIKPVQDRVDQLNRTHSQAQARMGNILLIDSTKCDVSNLLTPDKNGLMIFRTLEGSGASAEDCVKQIPLQDTTAGYNEEMAMWKQEAENTTGAHAPIQGRTEDPSQTLGQFETVQQMAQGRISSLARLMSESFLMPQTRRFYCNFQQYMPDKQVIQVIGKGKDFDPENPPKKFITVIRDKSAIDAPEAPDPKTPQVDDLADQNPVAQLHDIQGDFDVVPHDGAMPGADAKIVAAASRAIEAYSNNPMLGKAFDNTQPGAIDPISLFRDLMKKSGLPIEKYAVTRAQAGENAKSALMAAGGGITPAPAGAPAVPAAPAGSPPPTSAAPQQNLLPSTI